MTVSMQGEDQSDQDHDLGTTVIERTESSIEQAPLYKVLLLNDDYTPMEFVVAVLEEVFRMSAERAVELMLRVHIDGVGVAGVFTHEIAETKASQVLAIARSNQHPLQCVIEEE